MSASEPIAAQLADWLVATNWDDISSEARHAAKRCLLDYCGSAIRGSVAEPARMAREALERIAGGSGARRFPDAAPATPSGAALFNGLAAHVIELDDLHNPSTFHPAAPIIPAVLASAEREGASGAQALRALTLGYEVGIRVAEAVNPTHYRYWHPTGTCGAFGAAAGVAALLGLAAPRVADALGSAGTQAAGLWAFIDEGAMSKHLHAGRAAANGLTAAYLAAAGFTGAQRILESPRGFVAATTDCADPTIALRGLGDGFKILENGFKVHACCGHTHTALDLAIQLGERVPAERIERVEVGTYGAALDVAGIREPRDGYEARFSLRYCVAVGLLDGAAGLAQFDPERVARPDVQALLARVETRVDEDVQRGYPHAWGSRMTVHTPDGQLEGVAEHPRGMPANPLNDAELDAKFRDLATPVIGAERAARLSALVWSFEDHAASELFDVLAG